MTHISKIYSCVSTWHIICDLHGFLGFFFFFFFGKNHTWYVHRLFFFHSININEFSIFIYLFNTHRVLQFELVYLLYLLHLEISWCPLEDHYIDQRFLWILGEWFVEKGFLHLRTEKKLTWREYKSDSTTMLFLGFKTKILQHFNYQLFHLNELKTNDKKRVIKLNLWVCAVKPHYVTKLTKQIESFMDYIRK